MLFAEYRFGILKTKIKYIQLLKQYSILIGFKITTQLKIKA